MSHPFSLKYNSICLLCCDLYRISSFSLRKLGLMSRTTLVKAYAVELWLFQESTFLKALAIRQRKPILCNTPPHSRPFGFDGLVMLRNPYTYLVPKFNFVKRNEDCKDQTLNKLVMETLTSCQKPTLLNT